ncbi:MAG: cytochrome c biogenesis protein CcsA [Rubrivivax sp.]|jgi:ABC-type uncharacterized transport system permease subunit|nr:cytochrome c biogenesis protein CcsA [Rubrivivax sp.]
MILSGGASPLAGGGPALVVLLALAAYGAAAWPLRHEPAWIHRVFVGGWLLHLVLLVIDLVGYSSPGGGARLGFGLVVSMTVWLVIAVHVFESRLVPLSSVRLALAPAGLLAVLLATFYPGEGRAVVSPFAPLHFALGVGSYGLFGAAVLHALMLDAAERRLRGGAVPARARGLLGSGLGLPLLQLERLTFRFVEAGFVLLTATLLLGVVTAAQWRWDHKTVFSLLGWAVFAGLLVGRRLRGWRGRRATRWLYAGAGLLLLAYVGSRFVVEVLLDRGV